MEEEWSTLTNADFIQPGLNINMRTETSQDDICLQNYMNNNSCGVSCSPMVSSHNPTLCHSSLITPGLGQFQPQSLPLVPSTPMLNEMTVVHPMEISPISSRLNSPKEQLQFSTQPLTLPMKISPMTSRQHSPKELQLSPKSLKRQKCETSELANILKGKQS